MEKSLWDKAGNVGGLDGLMRSGQQLGAPEKKKRKTSTQASTLPTISEYAPPTNTSSDHLIACNPFEDDYTIPPVSGYTYFGKLGYSNVDGFQSFRMPPNSSPKMPFRNGGNQMFREQLSSFPKEKVMGKPFPFVVGMPEKSHFKNESFFYSGLGQTISLPGQHFRQNQNEEDFHRMMSLNSTSRNDFPIIPYRSQGAKNNFVPTDGSNFITPAQAHLMSTKLSISNQDIHCLPNNSLIFAQPQDPDVPADPSSPKSKHLAENSQLSTIDLSEIGQTEGTCSRPSLTRLAKTDVTPNEKCNRWLLHSNFSSNLPTDHLYHCGICSVEVNNIEDAIVCEASCQKWFHRTCTGMTEMAYALLKAEASAIWCCDTCMMKKDIQLVCRKK
ncbi:pygopus homolog 1 [Gastrophryne carolinensis]